MHLMSTKAKGNPSPLFKRTNKRCRLRSQTILDSEERRRPIIKISNILLFIRSLLIMRSNKSNLRMIYNRILGLPSYQSHRKKDNPRIPGRLQTLLRPRSRSEIRRWRRTNFSPLQKKNHNRDWMRPRGKTIIKKIERRLLICRSSMATLRFPIISIRSNLISKLYIVKIEACSDLFNRRHERLMLGAIIIFRRSNYLRKMKLCRFRKQRNNPCWVTKGLFMSALKNRCRRYPFIFLSNRKGRGRQKRLEEGAESLKGYLQRNKKRMKLSKRSFILLKDLWM